MHDILAEIITIGDEILIGQIVDTNSAWLGQELNTLGIKVKQITSISDDASHIKDAYQKMHENEMLDIYARIQPEKAHTWHWLSALENYYAK